MQTINTNHKKQDVIVQEEIALYQQKIEDLQFKIWKQKEEFKKFMARNSVTSEKKEAEASGQESESPEKVSILDAYIKGKISNSGSNRKSDELKDKWRLSDNSLLCKTIEEVDEEVEESVNQSKVGQDLEMISRNIE